MRFNKDFYKGKRILVTGHTGFKGSWLCKVLLEFGAEVLGYGLEPKENDVLFELCSIKDKMISVIGDIRDLDKLQRIFEQFKPEIVFHLAAQPLVRESYLFPVYTYDVNVMGTVNVLECVRMSDTVKVVVNVTTDKVYKNQEWDWGYREYEELNGYDPYSNSKSCSELVTSCYINAFLREKEVAVSTVRAGNVIGGGDFAVDRIVADCVRAAVSNKKLEVRNPHSIRPYQHVLDALFVYLLIAEKSYNDIGLAGNYNVGPDEKCCITTGELVNKFWICWGQDNKYVCNGCNDSLHEAVRLKLDCSKIKNTFGWHPVWDIDVAINKVVEWFRVWEAKGNISDCMNEQIELFFNETQL